MVMSSYLWLWVVIDCYKWLCTVIHGYKRSCMDIPSLFMVICPFKLIMNYEWLILEHTDTKQRRMSSILKIKNLKQQCMSVKKD